MRPGEVELGHSGEQDEDDDGLPVAHVEILHVIDAGSIAGIGSVRNDLFPSFTAMPRPIAVLIFPDFQLLDAAGPITAFEVARHAAAPPAYGLRVIARAAGIARGVPEILI